jgi:hypothetical protein
MTAPPTIAEIERLHWWMLAGAVLLAALVPGLSPASVAAGGLFMGASVNLMKRLVARLVQPGGRLAPALALMTLKTCLGRHRVSRRGSGERVAPGRRIPRRELTCRTSPGCL